MQKLYPHDPVEVPTAGTAVQVQSTTLAVSTVIFQADPDNDGAVYIGDSTVNSDNGLVLFPEDTLPIVFDMRSQSAEEIDLADFWVDAENNGNKVRVHYIKRR